MNNEENKNIDNDEVKDETIFDDKEKSLFSFSNTETRTNSFIKKIEGLLLVMILVFVVGYYNREDITSTINSINNKSTFSDQEELVVNEEELVSPEVEEFIVETDTSVVNEETSNVVDANIGTATVAEEQTNENILYECTADFYGSEIKTTMTYSSDGNDLLYSKLITTVRDIEDEDLGMYEDTVNTLLPSNIDGYISTVSLEDNVFTTVTEIDLVKIPSGIVQDGDSTVEVDIMTLEEMQEDMNGSAFTCVIK